MPPRQVMDLVRQDHSSVISTDTTLRDAATRLILSESDLLAVTDDFGSLVGIVNESAVVRALLASPPPDATIDPIITRHAESVRSSAKLSSVIHLFRSSCHTAIPVLDSRDRVCGLLLRREVMAELLIGETDADIAPAKVTAVDTAATDIVTPVTEAPLPKPQRTDEPVTQSGSNIVRVEKPSDDQRTKRPAGPYFLTGKEARRRLNRADERFGGTSESPW